ncbi:MAG: hypothetical protein ABI333_13410 [bacterium]
MNDSLAKLKSQLQRAVDLSAPWNLFHDELATQPEFLGRGEPAANPMLEQVVTTVGTKLLGREVRPQQLMAIQVEEKRFWHGVCQLGKGVGVFFYFEELDMGLLGLMRGLEAANVDLVRFSLIPVGPGPVFTSRNRGKA